MGMGKRVDEKFWILWYIQNNNLSLISKKLLGTEENFTLLCYQEFTNHCLKTKHALYHGEPGKGKLKPRRDTASPHGPEGTRRGGLRQVSAAAAWHSASRQTPGHEHETGAGPALTAGQRSKRADVCPKETER